MKIDFLLLFKFTSFRRRPWLFGIHSRDLTQVDANYVNVITRLDLRNCSFNHEADAIQSSSTIPQYAIITPTSKIVSQLEFQPPLSFLKQNALQNVYYFNSAKVFLNFKIPFWTSSDDGNRVPPISYEDDGNTENVKNGGGCVRFSLFIKIFFTIS